MSTVQPAGIHHPVVRNLARGTVVVLGDLAVLGLAFVGYAAYQTAFRALFFHGDVAQVWFLLERGLFVGAVAAVTWLVLSRWPESLGTAVWLALPTGVVLVWLGLTLYPSTLLAIGIGAAVVGVIDAVLLIAGRPWEQVLSITWVALLLLVTILTGVEP